jgi:hypothetical protein
MKSSKKAGWLKRTFVRTLSWQESPFSIVSSSLAMARKSILPTKADLEKLEAFKKLTPEERWKKVKKPEWTNDEFAQQRNKNCWLAYFFLFCSSTMFVATGLSFNYLNGLQLIGAVAYSGALLLSFIKKSIAVYALDKKQIISIEDWLRMPSIWVPTFNSKVFSDEKN